LIDSLYGSYTPSTERAARLNATATAALRIGVLGLGTMALTFVAGNVCDSNVAWSPWTTFALPAGVVVAAHWRWGAGALLGTLLGLLLALAALGLPWDMVLTACVGVLFAALLARPLLQRLSFDARLQRAADVVALAGVGTFLAAPPVVLLVLIWGKTTAGTAGLTLPAFVDGWAFTGLGIVNGALALLALDRSVLRAVYRGAPWRRTVPGGLAVLGMLALLWAAPVARLPGLQLAPLALLLPPVVLVLLALRGQLALAACGMAAAGLVVACNANIGASMWGPVSNASGTLVFWMAAALTVMLSAHAARVEWRSRSKRWEWALDGSHLGVADWHLQRFPPWPVKTAAARWSCACPAAPTPVAGAGWKPP
jgi:hypothetical protein